MRSQPKIVQLSICVWMSFRFEFETEKKECLSHAPFWVVIINEAHNWSIRFDKANDHLIWFMSKQNRKTIFTENKIVVTLCFCALKRANCKCASVNCRRTRFVNEKWWTAVLFVIKLLSMTNKSKIDGHRSDKRGEKKVHFESKEINRNAFKLRSPSASEHTTANAFIQFQIIDFHSISIRINATHVWCFCKTISEFHSLRLSFRGEKQRFALVAPVRFRFTLLLSFSSFSSSSFVLSLITIFVLAVFSFHSLFCSLASELAFSQHTSFQQIVRICRIEWPKTRSGNHFCFYSVDSIRFCFYLIHFQFTCCFWWICRIEMQEKCQWHRSSRVTLKISGRAFGFCSVCSVNCWFRRLPHKTNKS